MKKFKILLVALTFILATQFSYAKDLNTDTIGLQTELAPIIDKTVTVYEPENASNYIAPKKNASLFSFFNLFGTGEPEIAKYRRTEYSIRDYNMLSASTNTKEQQKVWLTLARGESRFVTYTHKAYASLKISTTVSTGIKFLVEGQLEAEVGGGYEYEYKVQKTMHGPDTNSSFNSRMFLHAIDYSQYGFIMNKIDVYAIYDSSNNFLRYENVVGTVEVPDVRRPFLLSWSDDVNIN